MSEFLELEDEEDIPCCPEESEPFPSFSVGSMEDINPCTLDITESKLLELIDAPSKIKGEQAARIAVAEAFCKYFKIDIVHGS